MRVPALSLSALSGKYTLFALILCNCALAFLALNLACLPMLGQPAPEFGGGAVTSGLGTREDFERECYPGLPRQEYTLIASVIAQTPYAYSPYVQFRIPEQHYGNIFNVEAPGYRASRNQAPWPPDPAARNVFFFGGSTLFGYQAPDFFTIPSFFQALAAELPGPPLHVYNFAQPYYFSTQERITFEQLLLQGFRPDIAVFLDGMNDLALGDDLRFTDRLRRLFQAQNSKQSAWRDALAELPVVRLAHRIARERAAPDESLFSGIEEDDAALAARVTRNLDRYQANQKMTRAVARSAGVHTLFAWQPVPFYKYDTRYHRFLFSADPAQSFRLYHAGYASMRQRMEAGQLGPDFAWLADIQVGIRAPIYLDMVHYGASLSKLIAAHLLQELNSRGNLAEK